MERIVRFQSEGRELVGMLHSPDWPVRQQRVGIIIVSCRVEYRVGPHRMFVQAARWWSLEGFYVLRVDFPGMGDSEGDENYLHLDAFPIHTPLDAMRYLKEQEGIEKVVFLGQCSGARNVLYAAGACPEVQHLILLSFPFNAYPFSSTARFLKTRISPSMAKNTLAGYLERLVKPGAWKRLLTGQSHYHVIGKSISSLLGVGRKRFSQERMYRSMRGFFEREGQALFVFGGSDTILKDFTDEFNKVIQTIQGIDSRSEVVVVEGANHTFSRMTWKADTIEHVTRWLNRQFPIREESLNKKGRSRTCII